MKIETKYDVDDKVYFVAFRHKEIDGKSVLSNHVFEGIIGCFSIISRKLNNTPMVFISYAIDKPQEGPYVRDVSVMEDHVFSNLADAEKYANELNEN